MASLGMYLSLFPVVPVQWVPTRDAVSRGEGGVGGGGRSVGGGGGVSRSVSRSDAWHGLTRHGVQPSYYTDRGGGGECRGGGG